MDLQDEHFPQLALVNLEQGATVSRRGLIPEILQRLGHRPSLPDEPDDLAEPDRLISAGQPVRVAMTHFDLAANRPQYGVDLFAALRYLIMTTRKLTLLVQSRTPFAGLLPRDHPLSEIDIKTLELRSKP